jgi:Domain of unknown function (DUF4126)
MMEIGTPLGLGFASGINAYLPLLSLAVSARWLNLYKVNPNFAFITSNWCMIALVILTIIDFVADKIPLIDHTWDAIHTFVRPLAGALVAAASSNQVTIPISTGSISSHILGSVSIATGNIHMVGIGLLVIAILGGILALMTHSAKATTRLISTVTTAGLLNVVLSIGEDILVVIAILLSLLLPAIMLILLVLFLLIFGPRILRAWSRRWGKSGRL